MNPTRSGKHKHIWVGGTCICGATLVYIKRMTKEEIKREVKSR